MIINTIELSTASLTRVGYMDVPVPADLLGLTPEAVDAIACSPDWATDRQPCLGAAAWFARIGEMTLVIDPIQALDVVLRADPEAELANQSAVAELFSEAGFPVDSIDLVLISHLEDIGMIAQRSEHGEWSRFFPNARILISELELATLLEPSDSVDDQARDSTRNAWSALLTDGHVESFTAGESLAPGIIADVSGGHSPGHTVFHFGQETSPEFSLIGHLAVTPFHLATGECADLNQNPAEAWRLLHECADDGRLIAGALWPTPGYGRWTGGILQAEA